MLPFHFHSQLQCALALIVSQLLAHIIEALTAFVYYLLWEKRSVNGLSLTIVVAGGLRPRARGPGGSAIITGWSPMSSDIR